jgi:hypothetical protein
MNIKKESIHILISFVLAICIFFLEPLYSFQISKGQSYRVGIQVGHWPEAGAYSCDKKVNEIDISLAVAEKIKNLLEDKGIVVDILQGYATSVHNYSASAFVSLHTDYCAGSNSGYKVSRWKGVAGSGVNGSGDQSDLLVERLWTEYEKATGLPKDLSIGHYTPCFMTYYALNPIDGGPVCIGDGNNSTQIHGIDDSTPGAIIEMGWLSGDLQLMISQDGQNKMAAGIANGILAFLNLQPTLPPVSSASSTILVFDASGSMDELDSSGLTKIEASRRAGTQILNVIAAENSANSAQNQVGIASYSTTSNIVSPLTNDISSLYTPLNSIFPTERTAMADGLRTGLEMFGSVQDKKILILLSDGLANIGLNTDMNLDYQLIKQQVLDLAIQAGQDGICIYTVGFGDANSLDEAFLQQIATSSGCGSYYGA